MIKHTWSNRVVVAVRLLVPRGEAGEIVRPFDIAASDVDVLLELKPEGKVSRVCNRLHTTTYAPPKDETVITVGVMDLDVYNTTSSGRDCFLSLTTPHSLVCCHTVSQMSTFDRELCRLRPPGPPSNYDLPRLSFRRPQRKNLE